MLKAYAEWKPAEGAGASSNPTTMPKSMMSSNVLVVAGDGSGEFKTVQSAIDSIASGNTARVVIEIKPGTYKERIEIHKDKPLVTLRGTGTDSKQVVLTNDWFANFVPPATTRPVGTSGSSSTTIEAADFTAENLTFENSAGEKGQALALKTTGDRAIVRNCRLLGWQDTLCAEAGRQLFANCYIEGRVDFIFGGATAVFEHCTIHSKNGGYVTAARTAPEQKFGYVFLDCTLTGEGVPAFLGRPWQWDRGRKPSVTFIRTKMGPHIKPEGWNPWNLKDKPNEHPEENTRYAEFASSDLDGKPLDVSSRVPWSKQLSADEAA